MAPLQHSGTILDAVPVYPPMLHSVWPLHSIIKTPSSPSGIQWPGMVRKRGSSGFFQWQESLSAPSRFPDRTAQAPSHLSESGETAVPGILRRLNVPMGRGEVRPSSGKSAPSGLGGRLHRLRQAVQSILVPGLSGNHSGAPIWTAQLTEAMAALSVFQSIEQPEGPVSRALRFFHTVSNRGPGGPGAAGGAAGSTGAAGVLTGLGQGSTGEPRAAGTDRKAVGTDGAARPAGAQAPVIYRRPVRQETSAPERRNAENGGEEILKAQTVTPAQEAAMNAAYSYGVDASSHTGTPASPLTREQEERIAERILEDINYNRMAAEVLDRVERRLRVERRKIGR